MLCDSGHNRRKFFRGAPPVESKVVPRAEIGRLVSFATQSDIGHHNFFDDGKYFLSNPAAAATGGRGVSWVAVAILNFSVKYVMVSSASARIGLR